MTDIDPGNAHSSNQPLRFTITNYQSPRRPRYTRGGWTPREDSRLCEVVRQHGERGWSEIAKLVGGRSHKQCRERWYNNLKPGINRGEWTPTEETMLTNAHAHLGNKWACIARMLPGRTEKMVKTYWNSKQRRLKFPMDYNVPNNLGNQSAVMQRYARSVSTQESSSRNDTANEVTQVLAEEEMSRNFDLNKIPGDDDK